MTTVHRTVEIAWLPNSPSEWRTFSMARREAARLWSDLIERHYRIRRRNLHWPTYSRWCRWAKRRYPQLCAQSVQQIIKEFCVAVNSTRAVRAKGHTEARYPRRKPKYRDVIYTYQTAVLRNGKLRLPNGKAGVLRVPIPVALPGRLKEARLRMGSLLLVCEVPKEHPAAQTTIGVDLGVNTLIAATDGETALLISGREVKATAQWRNKRLAQIQQAQSRKQKGSRRWRRLQRRKAKMLAKARRRAKDIIHKATRKVADVFPNALCYVGQAFNRAAEHMRPKHAQMVSQAANDRIAALLTYKTARVVRVNEAYSSQTCPVCGERSRHGRVFRCQCGTVAPRDVIGAVNILAIGRDGVMAPGRRVPNAIQWAHPLKYPGKSRVVPLDAGQVARGGGGLGRRRRSENPSDLWLDGASHLDVVREMKAGVEPVECGAPLSHGGAERAN